jgi:hypothetical protein
LICYGCTETLFSPYIYIFLAAELGFDGDVEDVGFFISSSDHPFQRKLSHNHQLLLTENVFALDEDDVGTCGGWVNLYCSSRGFMDFCTYETVVI